MHSIKLILKLEELIVKSLVKKISLGLASAAVLAACGSGEAANEDLDLNAMSVEEIEEKAQEDGVVNSVGMPDTWANWGETWTEIEESYGITHSDTDMSSAEELATFEAEKTNASADIGDVGIAFGPIAAEQGLTLPYKTSYWEDVPEWAKDEEGHWMLSYTGQMSFITDTQNLDENEEAPQSFQEILEGDYVLTIGDVETGAQDQYALLNAAVEFGGDETNLQPGLDFFQTLAEEGRLNVTGSDLTTLEAGEVEVGMLWDFNGLNYADQIDRERFEVTIPPTSVMTGYTTVINRYAQQPHAAALAREYILSDEGQDNLAKGYARPIRENAELSEEAEETLLPEDAYNEIYRVEDNQAWEETTASIGQLWQENVIPYL